MAVRVRKLARELERSPEDVLLLLKDLGYERFRSADDMISETVAEQLRKLARKTPPRAILPQRSAAHAVAPSSQRADVDDFMAQLVPGVVRKFTAPPATRPAAETDRSAAAMPAPEPADDGLSEEWEALEAERAELEEERIAFEAQREQLAAERATFEATIAAAAAEPPATPPTSSDQGPSLLGLLEERGLRGVDEAERAIAALAAGHALGRHLAALVSLDPAGLRRVLTERLVLFGGPVPEGLTIPAVTVSEDRADLPGADRLHRTLDRLGETLLLNGHRRVLVVGVPPRWHTVLRDGVDPRVDLVFRATGARDTTEDGSRVDLVVGWNVELEPGKARRLDLRAGSVGDLLERWVAALAT